MDIIKICNRISMEGIKVKIYFKDIVYLEVKWIKVKCLIKWLVKDRC